VSLGWRGRVGGEVRMVTRQRPQSVAQRPACLPVVRVRPEPEPVAWAPSGVLLRLVAVIAALALLAAAAGLLWDGGEGATEFTAVTGETVELYGRGLYAHDSPFKAGANQGADVLTLVACIPLLLVAARWYARGSLRGHLLLLGTLVWFLYLYASLSLGTAYNALFLVYVLLFAASLYAVLRALVGVDAGDLERRLQPGVPRRALGTFMLVSGVVTAGIWLIDPVGAMLTGRRPLQLEHYTTLVTTALDIAAIVPAALAAGVLILRGVARGYAIAMGLLILEVLLLPMIVLQTIFQLRAGVDFTTAEIVGPIAGFSVLASVGIWMTVALLRNVSDETPVMRG
jgi:hypothetical protein